MHLHGSNKKNVMIPILLLGMAMLFGVMSLLIYKRASISVPISINKDPHPIALQSIPPDSTPKKPVSQGVVANPPAIAGWSGDPALRTSPDAVPHVSEQSEQPQIFPPKPKASAEAKGQVPVQIGVTPAQARIMNVPPQWSGVLTVKLPPRFQTNLANNRKVPLGALTATGLPTSIAEVTESRQKIAVGETYFKRPKTERTPVQFRREIKN